MSRTVFLISGSDARKFLQGLVTNDVEKIDTGLVYAAFLTPQGKFLADFMLSAHPDGILLDVDTDHAPALIQRLSMYKLRSQVDITETDIKVRRGTGPAPEGALADPRHEALGWRQYGLEAGDDGSDFDAIRVAHCIPKAGVELTPDSYILEAGFERLNGVDFKKGCYIGQEVTARMKHKTKLRKGFVTVSLDGEAELGTEIIANGKPAGTIYTQTAKKAIAFLRFDRASEEMDAAGVKVFHTVEEQV
ncbi:MAG: folate-binding protein [Pseudomonadota bacterium]